MVLTLHAHVGGVCDRKRFADVRDIRRYLDLSEAGKNGMDAAGSKWVLDNERPFLEGGGGPSDSPDVIKNTNIPRSFRSQGPRGMTTTCNMRATQPGNIH